MILLTLRDLRFRVVRFVVVTLLGAVVFALLFVATGLVEQFNREPFDTVDAFGATTWVLPEGVSGPFTASSTLPAAAAGGVAAPTVAPVVVARSSLAAGDADIEAADTEEAETEEVVIAGHEPGALGTPPVSDGRAAEASGEVVIDDTVDVEIGQEVRVGGAPLTVVGRSSDTTVLAGIPLVYVTLTDAQQLVFQSDEVVSAVLADGPVTATPAGTVAVPADDIAEDTLKPLESAIASVDLLRVLLWLIAAVIIGAVVYLSALERQRDFAVLKAVGVSNRTLLASLALQAVLVALSAVAIAAVLQIGLAPAFPLKVRVPAAAFWQLPVLAVAIALVAGAAGMRRVARSDPALAFAGAGG